LNLNESTPSSEIEGHACVCCDCGADVFPLPLRVNPNLHVLRAIARSVTVVDRRTGETRSRALLFCPACADPEEVQDYEQFESASAHDAAAHAAHTAAAEHNARRGVLP